ncbi:ABC transporter permease [Brunnivagina elsteri]|uniref:ABC-2 type transporter transmembrane domain-containing protein n=1 Tax=Brunnivagina elsteri CCALA 953 TaxID=987040 RepID=A0A2A2TKC2_9CYAN|nr:ABC transporter permease [Calothrix elsteri]PAX56137.1 hypothetical protein CK510_10555 [Calothrix elsteri CCALA 953]
MKRILNQCRKELVQFKRDKFTVALAFFLLLAVLLIYGFAIRLEITNIGLAIINHENSPLSRSYLERLFATNQFKAAPWIGKLPTSELATRTENTKHNIDSIDKGIARAVVIISPEFSNRIEAGKSTNIQVIVDGTDVANARVIKNSIRATNQFFLKSSGLQTGVKLIS